MGESVRERVRTKAGVVARLREQEGALRALGVRRLALFGSFVRESQHEASDLDVLVEFEPGQKSFNNFMDLSFFLEEIFQRQVDLLTPESLSPHIGPHILKEVEYVTFAS